MEVRSLAPQPLWNHFADLNAIPRASKKEEKVREFIVNFGKSLGLETITDEIGNVVIRKPATLGMENKKPVVLQSHLDMVHQKNNDTIFDFTTEGINMYIDGDWVKAKGTTLGADNGIGVASIMTILSSKDIAHPPLEGLFTIDEETGMTGAKYIDNQLVKGRLLLNLDTEDDHEIAIGCAGGIDTNTTYSYQSEPIAPNSLAFKVEIKGLMGGHSGAEIHFGRANANKLMNRFLYTLTNNLDAQIVTIDGGSLRNAIPRESVAEITIPERNVEAFKTTTNEFINTIKEEYTKVEPNFNLTVSPLENLPANAVSVVDASKIINAIYAVPNGVYKMSLDVPGFVETSSNLARVLVKDGTFITQSLQRSGAESTKTDIAQAIKATFENMKAQVEQTGDYPGWKPDLDSSLVHLLSSLYGDCFEGKPNIQSIHAGLECGLLGAHFPGMEMISFGPNILAPHSPDERVQISSVQKYFEYLLHILKNFPDNG